MSQFYQKIITEKSWEALTVFKKQFDFILIGGWAVYLYTHALKSKDIDIIALIMLPDFDFGLYQKILDSYKLTHYIPSLVMILDETREVKELGLNRHYFSQKKRRIKDELART